MSLTLERLKVERENLVRQQQAALVSYHRVTGGLLLLDQMLAELRQDGEELPASKAAGPA